MFMVNWFQSTNQQWLCTLTIVGDMIGLALSFFCMSIHHLYKHLSRDPLCMVLYPTLICYTERFVIFTVLVNTPELAVRLISNLVNSIRTGECVTMKDACRRVSKDRKTVIRFRNIYYLSKLNRVLFDEVITNTVYCITPTFHILFT